MQFERGRRALRVPLLILPACDALWRWCGMPGLRFRLHMEWRRRCLGWHTSDGQQCGRVPEPLLVGSEWPTIGDSKGDLFRNNRCWVMKMMWRRLE